MLVRFDTCNEFQPHHSNRPDIVRWTTCRFFPRVDSSHRLEQYLEQRLYVRSWCLKFIDS